MTTSNNIEKINSNSEKIVNLLLCEGASIACDETSVISDDVNLLPKWYDDVKFKRGQKFFHDNIFGMFFIKYCGLLTIIAIPSIYKILDFTSMSNTPLRAYRRYMATIFHICIWYDKDFKPGSDLWRSVREIRNRHFFASRRACKADLGQITQKDMALTQFGFFGYFLTKPEVFGIYNATEEELEGLIHIWKIVGYLLGIEDRFNLCKDDVEETREICKLLIQKCFAPALLDISVGSKSMMHDIVEGMSCFVPLINYTTCMIYLHKVCDLSVEQNNKIYKTIKLNNYNRTILWLVAFLFYLYQYYIFHLLLNLQLVFSLFLMRYFPFLAYIKFGYRNSHVNILVKESTD